MTSIKSIPERPRQQFLCGEDGANVVHSNSERTRFCLCIRQSTVSSDEEERWRNILEVLHRSMWRLSENCGRRTDTHCKYAYCLYHMLLNPVLILVALHWTCSSKATSIRKSVLTIVRLHGQLSIVIH